MRVQSEHPCKNGGWFHRVDFAARCAVQRRVEEPPTPTPDFDRLLAEWGRNTDDAALCWFARSLGIKADALRALGVCQSQPSVWAFPMRDQARRTIGIRLRNDDGKKWAVKGSHQGLFLNNWPASGTALVCEGPTDTAAALALGFWAIGRPSCLGNNQALRELLKRSGVRRAVIVADNDLPGINGAMRLAQELGLPNALLIPPAKDLRAFVGLGATRDAVECLIANLVWRNP